MDEGKRRSEPTEKMHNPSKIPTSRRVLIICDDGVVLRKALCKLLFRNVVKPARVHNSIKVGRSLRIENVNKVVVRGGIASISKDSSARLESEFGDHKKLYVVRLKIFMLNN